MDGMEAHRQGLTDRHRKLDQDISVEMKRPLPDLARLATMKKQKLRIKEELTQIMA